MIWKLSLGLALAASLGVVACKFPSKKAQRQQGAEGLIVNREIRFLRKEPEKNAGTLTFTTTKPVNCEIEYWSQSDKISPTAAKPGLISCPNESPETAFNVLFSDLNATATYSFRVKFWDEGSDRTKAQSIRVDENNVDSSGVNGSEMIIARVNIPQRIAEIHSYPLSGSRSVDELQKSFTRSLGCTNDALAWQDPYGEANPQLPLSDLSSDGFASGQAVTHADYANRLLLPFGVVQSAQRWQLNYTWQKKPVELSMAGAAYLDGATLTNGEPHELTTRGLDLEPTSFTLNPSKAASLSWRARNLPPKAYLILNLRGKTTGRNLTCIFPAANNQADITPDQLNTLTKDDYELSVLLEANVVNLDAPAGSPAWLISSQDWRLSRASIQ